MPKVSVIVITYNHRRFIEDAIQGVLNQTYTDYEVIITDDASTDGTGDIIREYANKFPDRVKMLLGETRVGIAGNINRGLSVASGEYIAWLAGDDLMYPSRLEEQVALLDAQPQLTGCHHDADILDDELEQVVGVFSELYSRGSRHMVEGGIEILFDPGAFMLPSTMMFRRNAMPSHGFDERLRYSNDWLFDIELYRQGRIGAVRRVLGAYRRHGANVTASQDLASRTLEENLVVLGIVQARYPELSPLIVKRRAAFLSAQMINHFRAHRYAEAGAFMRAAAMEGAYVKAPLLYILLWVIGNALFEKFDVKAYGSKKLVRQIRNILKV